MRSPGDLSSLTLLLNKIICVRNFKNRIKKKTVKSKKQYKKTKPARRTPKGTFPSVSHCALRFATAIANPWSEAAMGACIPVGNRYSQKVTASLRGVFHTGTSDTGFIRISPCVANDLPFITYTNQTYASTGGLTIANIATNSVNSQISKVFMSDLPYTAEDLYSSSASLRGNGVDLDARIVAIGLRVKYIGRQDQRGGQYLTYVDPEHHDTTNLTFNEIGARKTANITAVDRQTVKMVMFPIEEHELQFFDNDEAAQIEAPSGESMRYYPWNKTPVSSTVTTPYGMNPGVLMVNAPAGSSFSYDVIVHLEYSGKRVQTLSSPTEIDEKGAQIVVAAASKIAHMSLQENKKSHGAMLFEAIKEIGREIVPVALATARRALLAAIL